MKFFTSITDPKKLILLTLIVTVFIVVISGFYYGDFFRTPEGTITEFENIKWFNNKDDIINQFGNPVSPAENKKFDSLQKNFQGEELIYPKLDRFNKTVDIGFILHPDYGLVKGYYFVHFGQGRDCLKTALKIITKFRNKYELEVIDRGIKNKTNLRFCYAVLAGKATGYIQLKDPEGRLITFTLGGKYSQQKLLIQIETKLFYDLIENEDPFGLDYFIPEHINLL